ncbi:MAG: DUF202 domain-containing protein [Solirubrobacteraceae bacterium]
MARRVGTSGDTTQFDPGLARDRTALAWTRSALSMLAIGTLIARAAVEADLDILGVIAALGTLALALLTWRQGNVLYRERAFESAQPHHQPGALGLLMSATLVIAVVALIVTIVL